MKHMMVHGDDAGMTRRSGSPHKEFEFSRATMDEVDKERKRKKEKNRRQKARQKERVSVQREGDGIGKSSLGLSRHCVLLYS